MAHYAAFDVSDKETAIYVLDEHGKLVWKGKRPSEPDAEADSCTLVARSVHGFLPCASGSNREIPASDTCKLARHQRAGSTAHLVAEHPFSLLNCLHTPRISRGLTFRKLSALRRSWTCFKWHTITALTSRSGSRKRGAEPASL
jgi:hypothetical protein